MKARALLLLPIALVSCTKGGDTCDGPASARWVTISAPSNIYGGHFIRAMGHQLLLYGGLRDPISPIGANAIYDFDTGTWSDLPAGAPSIVPALLYWTGSRMVFWGGNNGGEMPAYTNQGGAYDPETRTWSQFTLTGAPTVNSATKAVPVTGGFLVWTGNAATSKYFSYSGASWSPISTAGAPTPDVASLLFALSDGRAVVLRPDNGSGAIEGGIYDPTSGWTSIPATGAPSPRTGPSVYWTGFQVLVWGGIVPLSGATSLSDGAQFNPSSGIWTPVSSVNRPNVPNGSFGTSTFYLNGEMFFWLMNSGAVYNPILDTWTTITPSADTNIYSVPKLTDGEFVLWNDGPPNGFLSFFDPDSSSWSRIDSPDASVRGVPFWTGSRLLIISTESYSSVKIGQYYPQAIGCES